MGKGRPTKFAPFILEAFESKKTRSLHEIYDIVQDNDEFSHFDLNTIKHRVRSALYNFQQNGIVQRTGSAEYTKIK